MKSESLAVAMELHDDPTAEEQLTDAIAAARDSKDQALEGMARAALGIYYHHHGAVETAKHQLNLALELLPDGADRDAAQNHKESLNYEIPCACSEELSNTARAVRTYVLERLPEDLVSHFGVQITASGGVHVDLEVHREPTPQEAILVQATIDEALAIYGRTTSQSAPEAAAVA